MLGKFNISKLIFILILIITPELQAQENNITITKEDQVEFVDKVCKLLNEKYVFPEVASRIEHHLKEKLAANAFDNLTEVQQFADAMTSEVQSISNDKHMRVRIGNNRSSIPAERPDPIIRDYEYKKRMQSSNYGFRKVEKLEGNIGYLDLTGFPQLIFAKKYADLAMNLLSESNALIIDLRRNGGGNPDLIQYVCSYLFEKPTHINSIYSRTTNQTTDFITFEKVDGKKMADIPLFILTSQYTFSGGEEFAYDIQTQKRGTLIGETTAGGANPGGTFPVTETLEIFIPTGRAINPITNTNWEGTGVVPDIKCEADKALETALPLAKEAAKTHRDSLDNAARNHANELKLNIEKVEKLFDNGKIAEAEETLTAILDKELKLGYVNEFVINQLGYIALGGEKTTAAVAIFSYNVKAFPTSANVYDSLGEAYMKSGDNKNAIINYRKSLELNPQNLNAVDTLKKLEGN